MTEPRLDDLLTRWAAGELSESEFAALEAILQADPEARRRLRQHAMLDEVLRDLPMPEEVGSPATQVPRRMLLSGLALAAALAVIVAGGLWIGRGLLPGEPQEQLANAFNARSIRFDSGSVKISLPNVGYMLIDGPADVELISPMRAKIREGCVRIHVTEESGHGFVVETPYGEITDLGTEFAIDVPETGSASVVVFDGAVDLRVNRLNKSRPVQHTERLVQGDGMTFDQDGKLDRIGSIITGTYTTFRRQPAGESQSPLIVAVSDNYRASDSKKFYEIVPRGLGEDALAYVDRQHDWNGVTEAGMPSYLVGADYVRTFNNNKVTRDIEVSVELSQPARLYVFMDHRVSAPGWLRRDFKQTKDFIALDYYKFDAKFSIWTRDVPEPGIVHLGPNGKVRKDEDNLIHLAMYGIAATALKKSPQPAKKSTAEIRPAKEQRESTTSRK